MSTAPHALLTTDAEVRICGPNWTSWIRTSECRSQSPVPYRLAIALYYSAVNTAKYKQLRLNYSLRSNFILDFIEIYVLLYKFW